MAARDWLNAKDERIDQQARDVAKAAAERDPRQALQTFADALNLGPKSLVFALGLRGTPDQVAVALRRWMDGTTIDRTQAELYALRTARLLHLGGDEIKPTRNLAIVHQACAHAARRRVIIGISSRAGYGKTVGLQTYRRTRGAVYYAHDKASSTKDALVNITRASGLNGPTYAGIGTLRQRLVKHLRTIGSPLIVIDEADTIQFRTLEVLRGIVDELGSGLVMAGIEGYLEELLTEKKYGRRPEQLLSRVAAVVPLVAPSHEEIQLIAGDYGVKGAREIDFIRRRAIVTGGYRRARMILEDAREIADDLGVKKINLAVLNEAAQYLPGKNLVKGETDDA